MSPQLAQALLDLTAHSQVKRTVCRQLRGQGQHVVRRVREAVDKALREGVSSSLVAISSRESIEGQAASLGESLRGYGSAIRLARVRGSVFGQDHRALLSATQQLLACSGSADFLRNMSALEAELEQGYEAGRPVVIVVEEMHEFCRRDKQVLLYSLLDLLHRRSLLFVVLVPPLPRPLTPAVRRPHALQSHPRDAGEASRLSSECGVRVPAARLPREHPADSRDRSQSARRRPRGDRLEEAKAVGGLDEDA